MLPRTNSASHTVESGSVQSSLALLATDCSRLSCLANGLAAPARKGLLQLIEAISARVGALAARVEAASAGGAQLDHAATTRQEMQSIQAELAIVQATLKGRVGPLSQRPPRTKARKEIRQMSRKPWLFDPAEVPELELLATDDNPELEVEDGWDEWDDWSEGEPDDGEPAAEFVEPQGGYTPMRDWKGHSPRSRGHRRHRSHRQL